MAKTLDLIKTVLQPSLNQEVANLCDSYRRIFDMAASNINENTGDTVPSSTLQMLIVKMLEEVGGWGCELALELSGDGAFSFIIVYFWWRLFYIYIVMYTG